MTRIVSLLCVLGGVASALAAAPGVSVTVTLRGKKYEVSDASSVLDVQSSVEEQAGLAKDQQSVLYKGKLLSADDDLGELGVNEGDTINIVPSKKPKSVSAAAAAAVSGSGDVAASPAAADGGSSSSGNPFAGLGGGENPFAGLGGAGVGIPGMPEDMDMAQYQNMMQDMMNSPMMDEFLGDPTKIEEARKAILDNPMLKQAMAQLPGFNEMVEDPEKWRESMEMAREMYEQQKGQFGGGGPGAGGSIGGDVDDLDDE